MAPPLPPVLNDDLVGDILLRVPPEDPECLVRASVVCKPWRRVLSDPGFPRRYREFHGAPPLLGILCSYRRFINPRFIPFKKSSPIHNALPEPDSSILDCRHGRVLLFKHGIGLIIWDPITNKRQNIGQPESMDRLCHFKAAVLCAVDGCDHLGCCGGTSLVVFVAVDIAIQPCWCHTTASASVYSTKTGTWNASLQSVQFSHLVFCYWKTIGSSLLTGDSVYFILHAGQRILKYDMAGRGLSLMSPPPLLVTDLRNMVLMKAEDGGLGTVGVEGDSLHLWAWRTGPSGITEWERRRVIQLDICILFTGLDVVDFAEGAGSIFVRANSGVFTVELKSGRARKILEGGDFVDIFPFKSFYTPEIMPPPDYKGQ